MTPHTTFFASPMPTDLAQSLASRLKALPSASRLTPEQLEVVYALAYAHVAQHQYEQALPIFSFLYLYGPTRKHYLVGLALCLQMQERYEEAIDTYALILSLYPDHYDAALRTAECHLSNGQLENASKTLALLQKIGRDYPDRYPWLSQVTAMQKLLKGSAT